MPGWTGEYEWVDTIPYDDMPRAFNPSEGYIVTANNAVVGQEYPHLLTKDWAPRYRARRIVDLIEADASLSMDDLRAIQGDDVSLWARRMLPYVTALSGESSQLEEAINLLQAWDGRTTTESPAAALFEAFRAKVIDATFADELGGDLLAEARPELGNAIVELLPEQDSPWFDDTATAEVETRDEILLRALIAAVQDLSETHGADQAKWRWGEMHTATFANQGPG